MVTKKPFHGKSQFDRKYYARFFSKYEKEEFNKYYKWSLGWFRFLNKNIGLFKNPGVRVLEIGCSAGYFSKVLYEKGYEVLGTDISKFILDKAKRFVPQVEFEVFSIEKKNIKISKRYDYIVAFEVFEHLKDPLLALKNSYKLLNKGGVVVLSTPFVSQKSLSDPTHINVHDPEWWLAESKKAGFKKSTFKYATFVPYLYRFSSVFSVGFPFKFKNKWINSTVFLILKK